MQKENNSSTANQLKTIRDLLDVVIASIDGEAAAPKRPNKPKAQSAISSVDFDLPERAFFNRYAQSLSGPERFALVVAYLAKGDEAKEVSSRDVEIRWSKMTSFLGTFNRAHPTRAKDRDLVNSPQKGVYHLRPNWREIIQ